MIPRILVFNAWRIKAHAFRRNRSIDLGTLSTKKIFKHLKNWDEYVYLNQGGMNIYVGVTSFERNSGRIKEKDCT
jgi:hypothetical protein